MPTPEKKKQEEEEEKKSDSMKDYYPPSPVYTPSYEEDAQAIVNNLVPTSVPVAKENIKDKEEDTEKSKREDNSGEEANNSDFGLFRL